MIPDDVLSTVALPSGFLPPRNAPWQPLVSYEYGGIAFQDGTRGLRYQIWKGEYLEGAIVLSADAVAPTPVLTIAEVAEFQFTFDRNMNVFVAYALDSGVCRFYWFDTLVSGFVTTELQAGTITPRCAHDDNRDLQTTSSDIILSYCRAGSLYYREQRERYQTEHLLSTEAGPRGLIQVGMNQNLRFQWQLSTAS